MADADELAAAQKYFDVIEYRSDIQADDYIIPRYSALPYYQELCYDVHKLGAQLVNSYEEHKWIADFEYYEYPIGQYTFKTWDWINLSQAPKDIAYIVKGATNSKKFQWNTHMYAPNRTEASRIGAELANDSMIGTQRILFREYIPLETLEIGINGLPFTNEWRFFFYQGILIDKGFYWSCIDDEKKIPPLEQKMVDFAYLLANKCIDSTTFFVLDIAKTEAGQYILVEINDGMMSGLNTINPINFYKSFRSILHG